MQGSAGNVCCVIIVAYASWQKATTVCKLKLRILLLLYAVAVYCNLQDTEQLVAAGANELEVAQRWQQQTQVCSVASHSSSHCRLNFGCRVAGWELPYVACSLYST